MTDNKLNPRRVAGFLLVTVGALMFVSMFFVLMYDHISTGGRLTSPGYAVTLPVFGGVFALIIIGFGVTLSSRESQ